MFSMPLFILENNFLMQAIFQLLLATIIIFINRKFFTDGFNGLWHLSPNMNTLVAIGSLASYIYSCSSLYLMTDSVIAGDFVSGKSYLKDMYFESSAMILTLITFGRLLESISKGKTQNALFNLINLAPKTAFLLRENKEIEVPVEEVKKDDIFVVRDGKSIPVDGVIIEGFCSVDESSLTGESIPADKKERDLVYAGSILHSGFVKCKALKEIRRQIAEKNDIAYAVSECTHQGDCKGTCPKCEAEVAYLERELEKRRGLGKKVCLTGVSLGVALAMNADIRIQRLEKIHIISLRSKDGHR